MNATTLKQQIASNLIEYLTPKNVPNTIFSTFYTIFFFYIFMFLSWNMYFIYKQASKNFRKKDSQLFPNGLSAYFFSYSF